MEAEKKWLFVIQTLYEELRHYREKEFHTFMFAFPIIAAGFLPDFRSIRALLILLTLFGGSMVYYICRNHWRMMRMKNLIVQHQEDLGINKYFGDLRPDEWRRKNFRAHLGMMTYVLLLAAQLLVLWKDILLEGLKKASG